MPSNASSDKDISYLLKIISAINKGLGVAENLKFRRVICRLHPFVDVDLEYIKNIFPNVCFSGRRYERKLDDVLNNDAMNIIGESLIVVVGPSTVFLESIISRKPTILLSPEGFDVESESISHFAMRELISFLKKNDCYYQSDLNNLEFVIDEVLIKYDTIKEKMSELDLNYFVSEVIYEDVMLKYILEETEFQE
jgi:hypothetical protein